MGIRGAPAGSPAAKRAGQGLVLRDAAARISAEEKSGVILDYDAAGRLIALEVLDASARVDGVDTVQLQVIPKPARQSAAAE